MLKRLFLSSLVVVALAFATPIHAALINPAADVLYHPVTSATTEAVLTSQINATLAQVNLAYAGSGDEPPAPALTYADSYSKVFADQDAGAAAKFFSLNQYDPSRTMPDGSPVGQLQGVLLYMTVHLKSGRQVLDNEANQDITGANVQIGVSLSTWSMSPGIDLNFQVDPKVSVTGNLAADPSRDWVYPVYYPDVSTMTQAQIDAVSAGPDRLAAIIDPDDPDNLYQEIPIYTAITDPDALSAFIGDGKITFGFMSSPTTSHFVANQNVIEWTVSPTFDVEARVVYLYSGVPEPATMALLSAAFLPVLARRFRKKNPTVC